MPRQFDVVIEPHEEGYYAASAPQLPGCRTQTKSLDDAIQKAVGALANVRERVARRM